MVDASALGIGTVLDQVNDKGQMQVISYKSRIFTGSEQNLAVFYKEFTAVVFELEIYEVLIIGSKHPITIFTDHKPIISLFPRKSNINLQFFRYQILFTCFPKRFFFGHRNKFLLSWFVKQTFFNQVS